MIQYIGFPNAMATHHYLNAKLGWALEFASFVVISLFI